MKERPKFLRIFESHGVSFIGTRGDQIYGSCPFTGKEDKFYVNMNNGLWDSKTAGLAGNVAKFLELRSKDYQGQLKKSTMRALAENRQLAVEAFNGWEIGWDHHCYTFPIRNTIGDVVDIRRYDIQKNIMMSTAGASVGLAGAHHLLANRGTVIYLCEGEWDAIAMKWLLKLNDENGVVLGLPGAGTFKSEWVPWFSGRSVHTLYDADMAGERGEQLAQKRLTGSVRKLTFVHWPEEVPNGFDVRDWVIYGVTIRNTPEICFERLKRRFRNHTKIEAPATVETKQVVSPTGKITIIRKKIKVIDRWRKKPPTISDVHEVFNKWFFLNNVDVIDVMLATVLTQRIDGSPVWIFLVGPPGSCKTAMISSLSDIEKIYATSSLTAPSLISGANFVGSGTTDPSLIPKLDGKILVVKDFTSILSLSDREQKEIFGILRDAYDGRCGKSFGNGVERYYSSRFTVLAATTPQIYSLADQHQALGERFLKFSVGDNLHHLSENEIIIKAIENADRETAMREELQNVVKSYVERTCANVKIPELPQSILLKIVSLAKFGARLRGTVPRDHYRNDIMVSRPMAEVGTRLGQQLSKLARGMAMVHGRDTVNEADYLIVKKVILDTISQRNEDVLRAMIQAMGGTKALTPMSMRDLAMKTHYPFATIQRLMQDLMALKIIKRVGAGVQTTWTLSEYVHQEVLTSELYTPEDLARPGLGRIRMIKKRVKKIPRFKRIASGVVVASTAGSKFVLVPKSPNGPAPPVIEHDMKPEEEVRVAPPTNGKTAEN